ncbi:universal stress protein [bacterium]|nr:universal stress protein [bacterium]
MYKHILFPTDGSDASFAAFPHALDLARTYKGKISILNLHEEFISHDERQFLRVSAEHFEKLMAEKAKKARDEIETVMNKHDVDVPVDIVIRQGNAKQKICELRKELGGDIIVMATRGHSNLGAAILGSVAEYVVRNSTVPVLVVHG